MKTKTSLFLAIAFLSLPAMLMADTTVKLSGVHLCCGSCVKGIEKVMGKIEGASADINKDGGTITVKAKDDATAKKALAGIGRAGYYGKSDNSKLKIRTIKVPDSKVTDIKVGGVHLCCGKCVKAIDKLVGDLDGAESHDAKKGSKTFTIKGTYNGAALLKHLNEAGLNGRPARERGGKKK